MFQIVDAFLHFRIVTDGQIHELALALSQDRIAVENRGMIYNQLKLPTADFIDWNRINPYGSTYSFFAWTLEKFVSVNGNNASWNNLIEHLNQLKLNSVVRK